MIMSMISNIEIVSIKPGYAEVTYKLEKKDGEWPNDLITWCDNKGDMSLGERHFGGKVFKNDTRAIVKVYVD
jgi:hypothetical protein